MMRAVAEDMVVALILPPMNARARYYGATMRERAFAF